MLSVATHAESLAASRTIRRKAPHPPGMTRQLSLPGACLWYTRLPGPQCWSSAGGTACLICTLTGRRWTEGRPLPAKVYTKHAIRGNASRLNGCISGNMVIDSPLPCVLLRLCCSVYALHMRQSVQTVSPSRWVFWLAEG
jgi:hypothetical protein